MIPLFIGYAARVLLPLAVVLGVALAGAGVTYKVMSGKVARAEAQRDSAVQALQTLQEQRKKDQAVLARRAAANAAAARAAAATKARLLAAVQVNQSWANEPLPKEIQDALRDAPGSPADGLVRHGEPAGEVDPTDGAAAGLP